MILTVYIILITYFLLGVIGFYFINRKRETSEARKSWIKTLVYFIIINILCLSIIFNPIAFRCIAVLIIIRGFYELFKLFRESGYKQHYLFLISVLIFAVFSSAFYFFSGMEKELIFFTLAILSIFDSFSTITGKLWGRRKIFPNVSPNKTVEGFWGGTLVAILSGLLLKGLIDFPAIKAIILATGVALFAFIGDFLASFYKRKYNVKDFSSLIPEHGGFLDRFDSLIAGGAWVAWFALLTHFLQSDL
jgi:phosphatidate cytidylyltransferase